MNQRIAKKIESIYGSERYWSRYTVQQRGRAALVDGRWMTRRSAAVGGAGGGVTVASGCGPTPPGAVGAAWQWP